MNKKFFLVICVTFWSLTSVMGQELKPFQEGDRVAFLGNSITEAGYYESYVWLYYMTHFPNRRITVMNAGIGGDTAENMDARFEDDVLPMKPSVVVLSFGMNDSGYFEFLKDDAEKTAKERVENSYNHFVSLQHKLEANPEIRPAIMTTSPYDENLKIKANLFPGKSKTIEKIVAFQKRDATKKGWPYIDLYHPMSKITKREQKKDSTFTLTGPDRIHPGTGGHLVMASIILKNQGLAGKPVAIVALDARKEKVEKTENATINDLKSSKEMVSFNYDAKSLPFPVDSTSQNWGNPQKEELALKVYPFIKDFNQEIIQINNLKKENYILKIDGKEIARFSSDSLANGINMALLPNTPQNIQANHVMYLNEIMHDVENDLRQYYWLQFNYFRDAGYYFDDSDEALRAAKKEAKTNGFVNGKLGVYKKARFPEVRKMWKTNLKELADKVYEINKPKTHKIEIVPTTNKK